MGGATMRKIASVRPRIGKCLSPPIRPLRGHLPPQEGEGFGLSNASRFQTSSVQSLAPQRIADFSISQTRPGIPRGYTALRPVAGKGARPCDLVAAGVCGAGRSRPRPWSALASSEVRFRPGAAPGGSGTVSPVVQRVWRRESDRSGARVVRTRPSRRGRGSGKGLIPPLVRGNTSRTAPGKPRTRSDDAMPKHILPHGHRASRPALRRPFPSLQREIA
jgi:hypothetical protein